MASNKGDKQMYLTVNMNGQDFDVQVEVETILDELSFSKVVILEGEFNDEINITSLCVYGELHDSLAQQAMEYDHE